MKPYILSVMLLISSFCLAQESDDLIGKWVFSDLYNADELDEVTKTAVLTQLKGQLFFLLKESENFEANILGEEFRGEWMLVDDKHLQLIMDSENGREIKNFEILAFEKSKIALKVGEGAFWMEKN